MASPSSPSTSPHHHVPGCPLTHGESKPPWSAVRLAGFRRWGRRTTLSSQWQHGIEISLVRAMVFCFVEVDTPSSTRALLTRECVLFPKRALSLLGPRLTHAERRPRQGSILHRRHRLTSSEHNHSQDIRGCAAHPVGRHSHELGTCRLMHRLMSPRNGPSVQHIRRIAYNAGPSLQHPHCSPFTAEVERDTHKSSPSRQVMAGVWYAAVTSLRWGGADC